MTKYRLLLTLLLFCFFNGLKGQSANIKWSLVLDGYNDVYLADLVIDSNGFTYAAINYTSNLKILILNKNLPTAKHVSGLILKINKQGKPVWAHPFTSYFDNRIKDIDIAPNGDLLITGFGDGLMCFPGLKDTLKVGIARPRSQGFYAARYSAAGEPEWVQYWNCPWGEGLSIAANSRNEVYMTYYHKGKITQNGDFIDSIPRDKKIEEKFSFAKFNEDGKLLKIYPLGNEIISSSLFSHNIKFDHQDNMILYGRFRGKIKFTDNDSLINDSYSESFDSYFAKYSADGTFLWSKKIGGQNNQSITDIGIAPDNSIYATGAYSFECILGNGISVIQKSKYEWKSGNSFFYLHLFDDGELDFMRCEDNKGYDSHFTGRSIALGPNKKIHIVGNFNDTLKIDGFQIVSSHHNQYGLYSCWDENRLNKIEKIGDAPNGSLIAMKISINKNVFTSACEYHGDGTSIQINGKQKLFSNNDYGRSCVIYGGEIPDEVIPNSLLTSKDTIRKNRIELIKPLLACLKPDENPTPNLWFPKNDERELINQFYKDSPCGIEVKGLEVSIFPNPTLRELNIKASGLDGIVQLDILSENGQLILTHRLEEVTNEQIITLDLSHLSSGSYFLRVIHKNYEKAFKVIKVN